MIIVKCGLKIKFGHRSNHNFHIIIFERKNEKRKKMLSLFYTSVDRMPDWWKLTFSQNRHRGGRVNRGVKQEISPVIMGMVHAVWVSHVENHVGTWWLFTIL